ncbi:MAG: universal stress protein [Sphingobacteriaceae bacterium]|nr:universal stress protein [Sphingobacteriaceae bacterium]
MKTILVPLDFSDNSIKALDFAAYLVKETRNKLLLMHAYQSQGIFRTLQNVMSIENATNKKLQKLSDELIRLKNISCSYLSVFGSPIEAIVETVDKRDVSLVVMGTKGADGLKELFVGSNTSNVIGKTTCPVLVVPENYEFKGIKKITFATKFHTGDALSARRIMDLGRIFRAKIEVVHFVERDNVEKQDLEEMDNFRNLVLDGKIDDERVLFKVDTGVPLQRLNDMVKNKETDLLVLSTKKRDFFKKLLEKSVSLKMTNHIMKVPIKVFHYDNEAKVIEEQRILSEEHDED